MAIINEKKDIQKIKKYLEELGFCSYSHPESQNYIYSKNNDVVIIKNNKKT